MNRNVKHAVPRLSMLASNWLNKYPIQTILLGFLLWVPCPEICCSAFLFRVSARAHTALVHGHMIFESYLMHVLPNADVAGIYNNRSVSLCWSESGVQAMYKLEVICVACQFLFVSLSTRE